MKKSDWQYLVDTLLFVCIVSIVIIGFLMGLVIPKGPALSESSKYFLGLHRHQWGNIHFYFSIAFTALVIIHLILSWGWIKGKSRQVFKRRWDSVLIFTAIISLSILILIWILLPKYSGKYEDYGKGRGKRVNNFSSIRRDNTIPENYNIYKKEGDEEKKITRDRREEDQSAVMITGRMTLLDIERATGVSAREIADKLGLSQITSLDETLGRLRKKYSFTMQELRDTVSSLMKERQEKK